EEVCGRHEWELLMFCLMSTHVHLLIRPRHGDLAPGMQRLQSDYARAFNRRHRRRGALFAARYDAVHQQTEEQLLEATEEHLAVKRVLADMLAMEATDDRFDAKLTVLKEQVRHHARDEEEGKLFKKVRRMMSADELAALGNELLAMFEDLMEQEPRMEVPSQTREAAPLEMMNL
ncbi:MAG: transposase, partial [Deltaproteobacteria bacterium]|nr:transposase [Deltaproteobacteria bacterium]